MNQLVKILPKMSKFNNLITDIKSDKFEEIYINGLNDSQKMHMLFGILNYTQSNGLVITYSEMQAKKLYNDIKFYSSDDIDVVILPKREITYFEVDVSSKEIERQRLIAIDKAINSKNCIIITTIEAIMQKMCPIEEYINSKILLNVGDKLEFNNIIKRISDSGYERSDIVEGSGQYAVRGGIIDIFPLNNDMPIRIEFFGDEIESIREFDIVSQKTIRNLRNTNIIRGQEFSIQNNIENVEDSLKVVKLTDKLKENVDKDLENIDNGKTRGYLDKYFDIFVPDSHSFLQYILRNEEKYKIFFDEENRINQKSENILFDNQEILKSMIEKENIIGEFANKPYTYDEIRTLLKDQSLILFEKLRSGKILHAKRNEYSFSCREVNFFRGTMDIFIQEINNYKKENKTIVIVLNSDEKVNKISKQLIDNNISNYIVNLSDDEDRDGILRKYEKPQVYITCGTLSCGFEYSEDIEDSRVSNLVVISEEKIGNRIIKKNNKNFTNAEKVMFSELSVGDYVVHVNHGIGQYLGIKTIEVSGIKKDYIILQYNKGGMLYVPTNQMDNVMKYLGDSDNPPKLNTLGTKEWYKTKVKAKESLQNIAKELIQLYSDRQNTVGFAFSKDTVWQSQFEEKFPYQETEDQLKSIEEVKKDMESQVPMDRLLCGDVGYGKTEVAIRAAFKATMDQKQVAYLVPTTVLAHQQYEHFKERMKDFPVKVEMLSRFRTKGEQAKILKQIKSGEIDIIIGTHRILQKDIIYKDLGLLIIDEEQRFGVKHKEIIKQYKKNVDVLAMSATPIPRTMHMSIVGIRDMSTIYDPPQERIPVQTYVLEYNDEVIKQAVENEIDRNGQVFYIYNKIEDIERVAHNVSKLVPEARVAYAHGRMSPNELESIMFDYINHKIDVLVCTTILEAGIDIPNANTIIIENADRMGLSQLYQIRGRVGRSNKVAHAYITYKKDKVISEVAEKRLKAIKEFTEFGSGFKIALRDLEIRGAGNILGAEQHGHMESVGYDMYCRLLEEAIREIGKDNEILKDKLHDKKDIRVDIDITSYIPNEYISNEEQKIQMYQKIAYIHDDKSRNDIILELNDRYGEIPKPVMNLIQIMEIKVMAEELNIDNVKQKDDKLILEPLYNLTLTNTKKDDILATIKDILKGIMISKKKERRSNG